MKDKTITINDLYPRYNFTQKGKLLGVDEKYLKGDHLPNYFQCYFEEYDNLYDE